MSSGPEKPEILKPFCLEDFPMVENVYKAWTLEAPINIK